MKFDCKKEDRDRVESTVKGSSSKDGRDLDMFKS